MTTPADRSPVNGPELAAAVQWWTDILGEPLHHTGSRTSDVMAWTATTLVPAITSEQIERFKVALTRAVCADVEWCRSWQEAAERNEPQWGQVFRTLATDYGPEPPLADALEAAGISALHAPMKTVMWVSPGRVRVGLGHGAPVRTIYEMPRRFPLELV